ncbi:type II toxin-antitoxin system prevent-host-death family antitoxin [Acidicapsa dinghuensis]|uniref:Antitoxin n=1 Tax=Acidicapsa dinghuensis TaxID=2218256 RepID=A0ABW1EKZ9_9BACT|nr:type II toxin-antitoxin system prevent-host-death family antitoxin [Acidicapsa dinghuensis]
MPSPAFDITSPLSDLVETTLKEGPQVVTKNGVETAVLVSIEEWKHLNPKAVTNAVPQHNTHGQESVARMLELRRGNLLPEGVTIQDLIREGRA